MMSAILRIEERWAGGVCRKGPAIHWTLTSCFSLTRSWKAKDLTIPYPRNASARFVLEPWRNCPQGVHPYLRRQIRELLDLLPAGIGKAGYHSSLDESPLKRSQLGHNDPAPASWARDYGRLLLGNCAKIKVDKARDFGRPEVRRGQPYQENQRLSTSESRNVNIPMFILSEINVELSPEMEEKIGIFHRCAIPMCSSLWFSWYGWATVDLWPTEVAAFIDLSSRNFREAVGRSHAARSGRPDHCALGWTAFSGDS